jgi:hypothetical protein
LCAPLFPPNYYVTCGEFFENDRIASLSIYNFLINSTEHKKKFKRNLQGALYKTPYFDGYQYINIAKHYPTDVSINVGGEHCSKIQIRNISNECLFNAIRKLGQLLGSSNNARLSQKDLGKKYALGYRDYKKRVQYKLGGNTLIKDAMRHICELIHPVCNLLFPNEYKDLISSTELDSSKLYEMGGQDYYMGQQMFFTTDYTNSSHIDHNDETNTIAIWVEEKNNCAEDWNFIYPNLSIGEYQGLVIKLQSGLMMTWDGSKIRHCSTVGKLNVLNHHVYGLAFVTKKSKNK